MFFGPSFSSLRFVYWRNLPDGQIIGAARKYLGRPHECRVATGGVLLATNVASAAYRWGIPDRAVEIAQGFRAENPATVAKNLVDARRAE